MDSKVRDDGFDAVVALILQYSHITVERVVLVEPIFETVTRTVPRIQTPNQISNRADFILPSPISYIILVLLDDDSSTGTRK